MEICYLIAFPDSDEGKAPAPEQFKVLKDAPYFQPIDIDLLSLGEETIVIEGYAVAVRRERYDGVVQMIECRFDLADPFAPSVLQLRTKIQAALQSKYIPETIRQSGLFEDYTVLLVQKAKPTPEKWIDKNAASLAKFIRSQKEKLDAAEIGEILVSRTQYSAVDMTVVDWEGAVIIAPNADYASDIALLKIGNYQLLRYRMLDESIENMLDKINEVFFKGKSRFHATSDVVRQLAEHKLEVMIDFERAEQNLLLIGDWYSAKLYEAIQSELYLRDWKENLRSKMENLESIVATIRDNFSFSLERFWGRFEMAIYMIMLFGYLYLFFADMGWIGP
jgi:predicted GIY-YIG superfamily endonuclease